MKRYIFSILLLSLPALMAAQDILFLKDGRWIEAKVLEIQPEVVKYKLFDFQEGPLYTVYKSEVRKIQYENGRVEWFVPQEERPAASEPEVMPPPEPEKRTEAPAAIPEPLPPTEPVPSGQPTPTPEPPPTLQPVEEGFHSGMVIGITAGANAATGLYDYKGAPEPPAFSMLFAPTAGASFDWRISRRFSLQSALLYRGKGDRIDVGAWISSFEELPQDYGFTSSYTEAEGFIQTYVGYLEWPVYPVLNLSAGFQIGIGPYLAIGLHGKERSDYKTSYYVDATLLSRETVKESRKVEFADIVALEDDASTRYFNRLDYGLVGYLGIRASKLAVGWTINYGLAQWEPQTRLLGTEQDTTETRHLTACMLLTFFLAP